MRLALILSRRVISGIKSAELKLARAAIHLRSIKRCIAAYSARQPHKIITTKKGRKKVNVPKSPPREISILTGEMVYQMRSALDHLVFEIIKKNPNASIIDPGWREYCQFPLKMRIPKGATTPLAKSEFSRNLPGISDEAFTIIERMQPYYAEGAVNNSLKFLARLSNIDKHRHLNLIRPRVRQIQHIKYSSGFVSGGWHMLDRGTTIDAPRRGNEADPPVYVNRRYRTLVSFNEREQLGDAITVPIDHFLTLILYNLETFVVPALSDLIKKQ